MIRVTYYGHSCFTLEAENYIIALDPYDDHVPGYAPLKVKANAVLCSHEHGDHAYRDAVEIIPGKKDPFKITEIHSFHDPEGGKLRGTNIIRIFECGGIKVAHFGDIGVRPTDEQVEMLKGLDAALVPVGGTYTLDAKEEKALMDEIKPRLIIPMHYRRGSYGFGNIATIKEFTDLYDSAVYSDDCSVDITNEGPEGVLVLKHIGQK